MNLEYNLKVAEDVLKNLSAQQQKISIMFVETMENLMSTVPRLLVMEFHQFKLENVDRIHQAVEEIPMKVLEIAQKRLIQFVDKMEKLTEIVVDWMNLEYNLKVAEDVLKNLSLEVAVKVPKNVIQPNTNQFVVEMEKLTKMLVS